MNQTNLGTSPQLGVLWAIRLAVGMTLLTSADAAEEPRPAPLSFLKDVAPILLENCVGCHSSKKAESRYDLTSFSRLAEGGVLGEGIILEPGDPEASYLVELIRPGGAPQMPRRLPLLDPDQVALIEQWVIEGARYDGDDQDEDWVARWYLDRPAGTGQPGALPHPVPITALAYSPDGARWVTAGRGVLILTDVSNETRADRIGGLPERVEDLAFSPDGRWLAIAGGAPGRYGSALLWRAELDGSSTSDRVLADGDDSFFAVAFSPDSQLVAIAGTDRTVHIVEIESGLERLAIEDHSDWVLDLAFSPDGARLATASRDGTSKVFDVATGATLATFSGHAAPVHTVAFGIDGAWVATGGADGRVRLWDPDDEARQLSSPGSVAGAVLALCPLPDGATLVAVGSDGTVRSVSTDGRSETLSGPSDWLGALALSPDGRRISVGGWNGQVVHLPLADEQTITSAEHIPIDQSAPDR